MAVEKLVYIAGYGRSGSTILDILLSQPDEHVGAGELTFLFEACDRGETCSCGDPIGQCGLWGEALDGLGFGPDDVRRARDVTRQMEARPMREREAAAYEHLWKRTLDATGGIADATCVVDSSKTSRRKWRRPILLNRLNSVDVRIIHLVRDPRSVMRSIEKGSNKKLEGREDIRIGGGAYRGLASWTFANSLVETHLGALHDVDRLVVRYEDLAADPVSTLERVEAFADLDLDDTVRRLEEDKGLQPGHGVRGNRLRRQPEIRFDPSSGDGPDLPPLAGTLGGVVPLTGRYDYS